jgi:hypothetical protein
MMTITPAAADVIRDWLRRSTVPDPVVCLTQVSDTLADPKQLYPAIYPRSRFLWFFTTMVGGFRFASPLFNPSYARQALKTGVLDVGERGLVLKDAHGRVVMPWR